MGPRPGTYGHRGVAGTASSESEDDSDYVDSDADASSETICTESRSSETSSAHTSDDEFLDDDSAIAPPSSPRSRRTLQSLARHPTQAALRSDAPRRQGIVGRSQFTRAIKRPSPPSQCDDRPTIAPPRTRVTRARQSKV